MTASTANPSGPLGELPEWHVEIDGCLNFRDAGGWPRSDGARMRVGALYRADDPTRLTADGRRAIEALGIAAVVDLRQNSQFVRGPGFLAPGRTTHVPLVDRVIDHANPPRLRAPRDITDLYEDVLERSRDGLGYTLDHVARALADGPVLVHCAYGKDRTGLVCALVHAAIGMPREVIVEDYARSHGPTRRRLEWMLAEPLHDDPPVGSAPRYLFSAPAAAMAALVDRAVDRHGSLEAWVTSFPIAGDTIDRLRRELIAS